MVQNAIPLEQDSSIEELTTLVRSVTKDEVLFLLENKYKVTGLNKPTLEDLVNVIERQQQSVDIIQDLDNIRSCARDADEKTFVLDFPLTVNGSLRPTVCIHIRSARWNSFVF
ncbi:hypothetical protein [Aneurinibacillus terranovensis]|uniref:hypothetical protein n=1 Tax=Aneurinibacillus terranovensis TaxID=278991 RepID=UPI000686A579|nr:hypothetical protein [Aneurinibacillus terranovensis]